MVENVETQALSVATNFDNLSDAELMRLTGQTDGGGPSGSVLSRLSINYDTEDENENPFQNARPLPKEQCWHTPCLANPKMEGTVILR